jgi:hypothetical protein
VSIELKASQKETKDQKPFNLAASLKQERKKRIRSLKKSSRGRQTREMEDSNKKNQANREK